jgi:3-hydroxybutyryl-CoA dehydrogenase
MNLKKVVVVGAGTMGSGIAQWFAQQGCQVELVDNSETQATLALEKIRASWDQLAEKGKLSLAAVSSMKNSITAKPFTLTSPDADLIIEAIIEDLEVKKKFFRSADEHFAAATIFASNTSSFPIESMARALSDERKPRFLGLHFFNPATIMKLVEVIKGQDSDPKLCQELYDWFEHKGKKPAHCKDSPGFIVNRVARNFYGEPLRIVGEDDESRMREVDRILREVGGFRMGPFELMDLIGIDVNYSVTCSVWEAYGQEPRFAPHPLQKKMVEEGRLGRKSRRGYFRYD